MKTKTLLALLALPSLAAASDEAPVKLNQLGLLPEGRKIAVVPEPSRQPLQWQLTDPDARVQASGVTTVFGNDPSSGDHVHQVDFSAFTKPGKSLALKVGTHFSRPFDISSATYERLPYDALAYFYHNRAGTPIDGGIVGNQWARRAGHLPERATCVSGADPNGNVWPGCAYTLDVTGGWYDAGDHGKYLVNGGITTWTLLNLYEWQRLSGKTGLFADGTALVPERGNGISDLLDEVRWEIEFFLKMQVPHGTRLRVPVGQQRNEKGLAFTEIDASGMAHHKVADDRWTAIPMDPADDDRPRILFPPSTGATLNLAAATAQCARVWRDVDRAFSDRCLAAAERAWDAAVRNPEVYAIATFTGSGAYGDSNLSDEFYWAAAELFATTEKTVYREALERSPHFRNPPREGAGWASTAQLGTMTLALVPTGLAPAERERLRGSIRSAADSFLEERAKVGYAIPFAPERGYPWGSTSNLLNRAMLLALAHDFSGEERYRGGVIDTMDYLLGRNPLDRSFISGYGARPMQNPHHRFWAHSADPKYPPPPPGALSGGPNQNTSQDEAAAKLKGCAPQKCWTDDINSFSMNEVAINWNAPLVWVSAWLAEHSGGPVPGTVERGQ